MSATTPPSPPHHVGHVSSVSQTLARTTSTTGPSQLLQGPPRVMQTKGGQKQAQGPEPLHPYEELRLRQCMANSSRLEQLGLPPYFPNGQSAAANSKDNKTNKRKRKDADYDPLHDDTGEQDLFDDDITKVMRVFWEHFVLNSTLTQMMKWLRMVALK
ncbi:unnamed protein product [Urochloa humidicola]